MSNTYSQIYVHIIFGVAHRKNLIHETIRLEVEQYMCAISESKGSKVISVYCNPDHVHLLIRLNVDNKISDLVKAIKVSTSKKINDRIMPSSHFRWQRGYAAFSYSKSQLKQVANYIESQPIHHHRASFEEELRDIFEKAGLEYEEVYLKSILPKELSENS